MDATKWIIICGSIFLISFFTLYFNNIKVFIQGKILKFKSKRTYKESKKSSSTKVKKVETQIRPILKPPEQFPKLNANENVGQLNPPVSLGNSGFNNYGIVKNKEAELDSEKESSIKVSPIESKNIKLDRQNQNNNFERFNNISSMQSQNLRGFGTDSSMQANRPMAYDLKLSGHKPIQKESQEELDREFDGIRKFLSDNPHLNREANLQKKTNLSLNDNSYSMDNAKKSYDKDIDKEFYNIKGNRTNFEGNNWKNFGVNNKQGKEIDLSRKGDVFFDGKSWRNGDSERNEIIKICGEEIKLANLTPQMKKILIFSILERKEWD